MARVFSKTFRRVVPVNDIHQRYRDTYNHWYAFTSPQAIACDDCRRQIPPVEEFVRLEVNQRTSRWGRWVFCKQCYRFEELAVAAV